MRRRRAIRFAIAAVVMVVMGGARGRALAHSPPIGTGLWWISSASDATPAPDGGERLVVRTPRGFLIQAGAANDLRLLCNEAVGIQDGEDASFAEAESGALVVTTFARGLLRGSRDGCQWKPVTAVATTPAFDVVVAPLADGPTELVVGGVPKQGDHFWAGRAGGTSWSSLANSDMPYTRIRFAPSNPSRLYVTGIGVSAAGTAVHRLGVSDDAGRTVVDRVIALGPDELQASVLGVDPLRPEHIYVRAESNSIELVERLLVSADGGQSFATAVSLHELRGFAQSDDGRQVWVGGTEGLYRSLDGGDTFALVVSALANITCLAFHANHLYACGVLDKQLVVAISDDAGASFRKVFSFDQVIRPVTCADDAAATAPAVVCASSLEHWRSEFGILTVPDPPTSTPPSTGPDGAAGSPSSGCSLAGGDRPAPAAAGGLTLATALALGCVRARRRRDR